MDELAKDLFADDEGSCEEEQSLIFLLTKQINKPLDKEALSLAFSSLLNAEELKNLEVLRSAERFLYWTGATIFAYLYLPIAAISALLILGLVFSGCFNWLQGLVMIIFTFVILIGFCLLAIFPTRNALISSVKDIAKDTENLVMDNVDSIGDRLTNSLTTYLENANKEF